jgi:3,4-dihydroxy-2-butanone 4-phosphate synthase
VTPDIVNFMAPFGRGLVCMPITEGGAARTSPMTLMNRWCLGPFTVSIAPPAV